jgi:TfoX/Sxy family transcriptional regulator of competence genes
MAYDLNLAQRIRQVLAGQPGLVEKKMFGGVGFLIRGNMACGVHGNDLIVRLGAERYPQALAQPHTRPFDMTGRPMQGWVMVAPEGAASDHDLREWVSQGTAFAATLPPK